MSKFFLEQIDHPSLKGFRIFTKYKNHKRRHVGSILQHEDGVYIHFHEDVVRVIENAEGECGDFDWVIRFRRANFRFSNLDTAKAVVSDLLSVQII